jgi:hypothetical protein
MKKIWILCIILSFSSCKEEQKQENKIKAPEAVVITENPENFDWLLGQWKRLDEEEGKETFENWEKYNDTAYYGIGFTMQNKDTIKQELIKLKKVDDHWNLSVKTPDELQAIDFKMTTYNATEFVCENTEIDFPNKIRYWIVGDTLNASVSNPEITIPFKFEKLAK